MTKTNGEATDGVITRAISDRELLETLIDVVKHQGDLVNELVGSVADLTETQREIVEKLSNMELPWGDGFNNKDRYYQS